MPEITDVHSNDFRRNLSDLLGRVYYQGQHIGVTRWNKRIARVVPEAFMQAVEKLIEKDRTIADKINSILNQENRQKHTGVGEPSNTVEVFNAAKENQTP